MNPAGECRQQRTGAGQDGINFMLSVVKGIEPKDEIEAMLAAQMAAVHMASMTFARRLAHVENLPQQDSAERAFNKLARTFTTQMEALKRYRTGGQQKVTVEHVTVQAGGQAIVGNVSHPAGGVLEKTRRRPHEQSSADASEPAMPCTVQADKGVDPPVGADQDRLAS